MNHIKLILCFVIIQLFDQSCSKNATPSPVPVSALTLVNAVDGANPFIVDFTGVTPINTYYSTTPQVRYGSFHEYSIESGNIPLVVYQTTDTTKAVFQVNDKSDLYLKPASIYSLFLCGQLGAGSLLDTLFTIDTPHYHSVLDSAISVRFVNLSPGSHAVSVNIQGQASAYLANNVAYKSVTEFQDLPATATNPLPYNYVFEFRDVTNDSLLATCVYGNIQRFKNVTIVLAGTNSSSGGSGLTTFLVNNY